MSRFRVSLSLATNGLLSVVVAISLSIRLLTILKILVWKHSAHNPLQPSSEMSSIVMEEWLTNTKPLAISLKATRFWTFVMCDFDVACFNNFSDSFFQSLTPFLSISLQCNLPLNASSDMDSRRQNWTLWNTQSTETCHSNSQKMLVKISFRKAI